MKGEFSMKVRRLLVPIAIAFLGLVLPARTFAATVTLGIPEVQAQAGGTVDVPINASGATGLSAIHFELLYDPQVVTPDTVSRGTLAGNNALIDFNAGNPGRLLVGIATLDAIKGDGPLAIVRFKVADKSETTAALTLDHSRAWESGEHAEVLVKTEPGKITIAGGSTFFILALVAICLAILLMLIMILILLKRRRKASPGVQRQGAPAPPGAAGGEAFRKAEDEYFRLKGRLSAGHLTQAQFDAAMKGLMIQDGQGRYWTIDANTGRWLVHNGQTWVQGQPY